MLKKKKSLKTKQTDDFEIAFTFRNVNVSIIIDEDEFTEEQENEISQIVKVASKNIYIDKSYVYYEGTKYEKLFFKEEGWNDIKKLLAKTKYGKKCTASQKEELDFIYSLMIQCYIYQFLDDYGYDSSGICIFIKDGEKYEVEIYKDTTASWKNYPGKWQSW